MKTYKQFVVESNDIRYNVNEGWGSGLRALGRSLGKQWVKRPLDIVSGIYGAQRAFQAATNPAGYDEPGVWLGGMQAIPMTNPATTTVKLGAAAVDAKRRYDAYMKRKKKEEETEK